MRRGTIVAIPATASAGARAHGRPMSTAMQTNSILIVLLSSGVPLLAGCGPFGPDPGPEVPHQAGYCNTTFEEDFPETRQVDLGFGPAVQFEPYRDGDEIETVVGGQGATMITPFVRVEKGANDGVEACFRVRVAESVGEFASEWNILFREQGDHMLSDGALYFITYTEGEVTLDLTVQGEGFAGTRSVNVVLK